MPAFPAVVTYRRRPNDNHGRDVINYVSTLRATLSLLVESPLLMRPLLALVVVLALFPAAHATTAANAKAAREAFNEGLKLQKEKREAEAFAKFREAAELDERNLEFATAREIARQQLVFSHLQAGNTALLKNDRIQALASFRAATDLDPSNQFAMERLLQVRGEPQTQPSRLLQIVEQSEEIELRPDAGRRAFQYRGDTRGLLEHVARSFGLVATFDENFSARPANFKLDDADFSAAVSLACRFAKAMWTPLSEKQIYFAADTAENRRQFGRMSLRTFYLPDVNTPQEMNEIVSVFRGMFDIRYIIPNTAKSTLSVRAPKQTLDAATLWLDKLTGGRPQVMLDVRAYQVNQTMLRNLGISLPLQLQVFHIPASALQLVQNPDIQELIDQLIASGGINQANTEAIAALLAQLQSQQGNPLFQQSFVPFGGGLTLFGVGIPNGLSISAELNESRVSNLSHMTLRAAHGNAATFRLGSRFPVLNGTFAPIINTPAINDLLEDQTFVAPFPSFSYEDIGITLKATPLVHSRTEALKGPAAEITLTLELEIRSLSGAALNGVPVISNRQFNAAVRLREGEPAAVAGMITRSEQRSISGVPGIGHLPLVGRAVTNENKNDVEDEILFLITPYIVRSPEQKSTAIWLPSGQ